jgi:hypothetical protein
MMEIIHYFIVNKQFTIGKHHILILKYFGIVNMKRRRIRKLVHAF